MTSYILNVNDLSSLAYNSNPSTNTPSLILLYEASDINNTIYKQTSGTPLVVVNSYFTKYAVSGKTVIYYEIDGEMTFPGPILPNSGVGNIYIQVPFITSDGNGNVSSNFNPPNKADVLVSLTARGMTSYTPVYSVSAADYGLYGDTTTYPALIVPLSVFFTNINMVNTIYRFIIRIYPQK